MRLFRPVCLKVVGGFGLRDPAICLICGKLFCSGGRVKDVHAECFRHARKGRDIPCVGRRGMSCFKEFTALLWSARPSSVF